MTGRPCRITGCTRPTCRRTVCNTHYHRLRRHGDPDFSQWGTANEYDIDIAVSERRAVPGMTRLERVQLGLRFTALGLSASEIARIVGVAQRTVHRWRAADRRVA